MKYQTNKDLAEASRYLKLLDHFCKTGQVERPEPDGDAMPWLLREDPLEDYLVSLLQESNQGKYSLQVVNSKLKSKIFYDSVGKFIVECVHHMRFQRQRAWTAIHRADSLLSTPPFQRMEPTFWQPLLSELQHDYEADGFDHAFFVRLMDHGGAANDETWERLAHDWTECIHRQATRKLQDFIDLRHKTFEYGLRTMMEQVRRTIKTLAVSEERAVQAWELMSGGWTETEFERRLNEMKIQDRYPEIGEIVARMGRTADPNGKARLTVSSGLSMKMEHSSGSDIEGITVGDDLSALLPHELAQYTDQDMESLFIYKYRTRRLQTFRYKSEMSKPSRQLSSIRAARKGPMIVCLDTSASMYGTPERIASTIIALLEEKAEDLQRDCFLIDFSVSIRAIDLMERRREKRLKPHPLTPLQGEGSKMLPDTKSDDHKTQAHEGNIGGDAPLRSCSGKHPCGLSGPQQETQASSANHSPLLGEGLGVRPPIPFIGGSTSAQKMMQALFDLLEGKGERYVNADVLWITDFMIPKPSHHLLARLQEYKDTGTRFYGIRIIHTDDKSPEEWNKYFNHIYTIRYRPLRRY